MLLGVVGAPNKGKSTFFAAATLVDAKIADYPFTTIEPNRGVTYVRSACPHAALRVKCSPRNSRCENGARLLPAALLDVAGLVPGAHAGKGLGNRFLDDLRNADALIQVIDASGGTDAEGNKRQSDPAEEIIFLEQEIALWIAGIIKRGWTGIRGGSIASLAGLLTGLGVNEAQIEAAADAAYVSKEGINWGDEDVLRFAQALRRIAKPIIVAANKADLPGAEANIAMLRKRFPEHIIIPTCADAELALRRAAKAGIVQYTPGDSDFTVLRELPEKQAQALERIRALLKKWGTLGVQETINRAVFDLLQMMVVYPVEDENKLADHFGNVLPDAFLLKRGSTALDLAARIHTDLVQRFVCAIDCRTKMRVGREHALGNGDVIKVVAGR
jgi:ribosome-binding ATPase YchF (GTP1/OBG family)